MRKKSSKRDTHALFSSHHHSSFFLLFLFFFFFFRLVQKRLPRQTASTATEMMKKMKADVSTEPAKRVAMDSDATTTPPKPCPLISACV